MDSFHVVETFITLNLRKITSGYHRKSEAFPTSYMNYYLNVVAVRVYSKDKVFTSGSGYANDFN